MEDSDPRELAGVALEVLESLPEGVIILDREMRKRYVNAAAAELLVTPVEALLGEAYEDVHPESEWGEFEQAFARVMESRVAEEVDAWYPKYEKHFRARILPCATGISIFFADVTAERSTHKRLLDDLQVLQQVVDHAHVGIVLKDLDGRYLLVNQAAAAPTGTSPTTMLGRTAADFYSPQIAERLRQYELEVARSGTAVQREETVEYSTGEPRTFLSVTFPAYDEKGHLVATGAVHADITERKKAEAELASSEKRFREIFAHTSLGQLVMTRDGTIVEVNRALSEMIGIPASGLIGQSVERFAARIPTLDERRQLMEESGYAGYELQENLLRADGTPLPVLAIVNVVGDIESDDALISVLVRDQSEVRALQERLVTAERMEAVGQLAAGIAHDVNNVLAAVSGYAQLLSNQLDDAALVRHLHGIFRSVDRASDLVAQLLAFARQQHLEPTDIEPCAVVTDLEDMLWRLLPPGIELRTECEPVGLVRADPAQLQQVLLNLVLNARDALPDGGRIEVTVDVTQLDARRSDDHLPAGPYAQVVVRDDGVGMPAEVTSRCFEPFFTTRRSRGGHGLGLSTAFGIARQSGGDLRVVSEPGRGTTFTLLLPLLDAAKGGSDSQRRSATTVLLADDDPDLRDVLTQVLEARGHRVLAAGDGVQALRLADAAVSPPDLLVSDVDMPHLDGPGLARAVRERWPQVPVLFVSGTPLPAAHAHERLLAKPFTHGELVQTVEALLTNTHA